MRHIVQARCSLPVQIKKHLLVFASLCAGPLSALPAPFVLGSRGGQALGSGKRLETIFVF